jgi:hypothetical protein
MLMIKIRDYMRLSRKFFFIAPFLLLPAVSLANNISFGLQNNASERILSVKIISACQEVTNNLISLRGWSDDFMGRSLNGPAFVEVNSSVSFDVVREQAFRKYPPDSSCRTFDMCVIYSSGKREHLESVDISKQVVVSGSRAYFAGLGRDKCQ